MRDLRAEDPADLVLAWEAVEEMLLPIPEGLTKEILRMIAAGLAVEEIAYRLQLPSGEVEALAARGRVRVLTAKLRAEGGPD